MRVARAVVGGRVIVRDGLVETVPGVGSEPGVSASRRVVSAPDNPRGCDQVVRKDRTPESRSRWRLLRAIAGSRIGPCSSWLMISLTMTRPEPDELRSALSAWLTWFRRWDDRGRYVWVVASAPDVLGETRYHVHVLAWIEGGDWPADADGAMKGAWAQAVKSVRPELDLAKLQRHGYHSLSPRSGAAVERYITRAVAPGWDGRRWGMSLKIDRRPVAEAALSASGMRQWRRLVRRWVRGRGRGGRRYARFLASQHPAVAWRVLMPAPVAMVLLAAVVESGGVLGQASESRALTDRRVRLRACPERRELDTLAGPWTEGPAGA